LKRKKSVPARAVAGMALIFAVSLLMTGCGTAVPLAETYYRDPQYQLADDCALLHIYRPGSMMGAAIGYDLYMNEWVMCHIKNKVKTTIKVTTPGSYTLWAKTEAREEIPVNIELGREYYVRCSVSMGAFVGRPQLELVDPQFGKYEFDKIPWKQ
jgi:hypothetical protein